jgi:hypothetical protein
LRLKRKIKRKVLALMLTKTKALRRRLLTKFLRGEKIKRINSINRKRMKALNRKPQSLTGKKKKGKPTPSKKKKTFYRRRVFKRRSYAYKKKKLSVLKKRLLRSKWFRVLKRKRRQFFRLFGKLKKNRLKARGGSKYFFHVPKRKPHKKHWRKPWARRLLKNIPKITGNTVFLRTEVMERRNFRLVPSGIRDRVSRGNGNVYVMHASVSLAGLQILIFV